MGHKLLDCVVSAHGWRWCHSKPWGSCSKHWHGHHWWHKPPVSAGMCVLSEEINASFTSFVWLDTVPCAAAASPRAAGPKKTWMGPQIHVHCNYWCKTRDNPNSCRGRTTSSWGSSVKYSEVVRVLNQQMHFYDHLQIGVTWEEDAVR